MRTAAILAMILAPLRLRPRARWARPRRLAAGAAGGVETSNLTHATSAHVAPQSAPVPPCPVSATSRARAAR